MGFLNTDRVLTGLMTVVVGLFAVWFYIEPYTKYLQHRADTSPKPTRGEIDYDLGNKLFPREMIDCPQRFNELPPAAKLQSFEYYGPIKNVSTDNIVFIDCMMGFVEDLFQVQPSEDVSEHIAIAITALPLLKQFDVIGNPEKLMIAVRRDFLTLPVFRQYQVLLDLDSKHDNMHQNYIFQACMDAFGNEAKRTIQMEDKSLHIEGTTAALHSRSLLVSHNRTNLIRELAAVIPEPYTIYMALPLLPGLMPINITTGKTFITLKKTTPVAAQLYTNVSSNYTDYSSYPVDKVQKYNTEEIMDHRARRNSPDTAPSHEESLVRIDFVKARKTATEIFKQDVFGGDFVVITLKTKPVTRLFEVPSSNALGLKDAWVVAGDISGKYYSVRFYSVLPEEQPDAEPARAAVSPKNSKLESK